MSVKEKLIGTLERARPAFLQGSILPEEDYKPSFFTFWNPSNDEIFYSDIPVGCIHTFYIYYYSDNPETIEEVVRDTRRDLAFEGFSCSKETDYKSDEKTHTGVIFSAVYREDYEL